MNKDSLSTEEAASILGVGVSTVKRWVDQQILPAARTCGGHRRVSLAELIRLVRLGQLPNVDLARLPLLVTHDASREPGDQEKHFHDALTKGDEIEIRAIFTESYQSGVAVETLADEIIRPALYRMGQEWTDGKIDVMHEHRGIQACISALCELKHLLVAHARSSGPVAVGGAPDRDPYLLPSLLAEMVLIDSGWNVVNLGANTPLSSFERALEEYRPRMLWLSVSFLEQPARFLDEYRGLHAAATSLDVAMIVGGQALTGEMRSAMPGGAIGEGLTDLAAFARKLHSQPMLPRRGRPRRQVSPKLPEIRRKT